MQSCWNSYKQNISEANRNILIQKNLHCYGPIENLAIIIEKMVYLKQHKLINMFYLSLTVSMIFLLLAIYFVRVYIQQQMKKHAIHDHDTHLFNRKYFLAEFHTAFARAKRENSPISMFFLSVNYFSTYDTKQQQELIKKVAHILSTVTRDSDTVCRFDGNHFAVLMPLADNEHALHLEERMKKALEAHDFHLTPEPEFSFKTTQLNDNETEEDFISRSRN